jgi:hypothetical protein
MWLKRGAFSASNSRDLFTINNGITDATYFVIAIRETDKLRIEGFNTLFRETTQVLRDVSAWYHLVVTLDTTNATAGNRIKMYLNGAEITAFSTSNNPTSSQSLGVNQAATHKLGSLTSTYFDGYLAETNFIDGQALTPSSFGETNAVTGVWQPKEYAGTYGTNGFYLNFSDNASTTTLGDDLSGNGNDWTTNNISVTAGVTYDSMIDVPTPYDDGGNGRGNYATLNAVAKGSTAVLSNGNLQTTSNGRTSGSSIATIAMPNNSGKYYWEVSPSINVTNNDPLMAGIIPVDGSLSVDSRSIGFMTYCYTSNIAVSYQSTVSSLFVIASTLQTTDILRFAYDSATNKIWLGLNGNWYNSTGSTTGDPASGANATQVVDSTKTWVANGCVDGPSSLTAIFNFGQRPFTYTPPTGFVALNTQNLPAPTISNGASYMAATTYTGTGSALTVANTVGSASFQPDLVWVKGRSGATDHALYDAVRGVQLQLESNTTTAETTETTGLTAFGSTGFTVGALAQMNTSAATYVAWQWNAGGSTVTNTSGSISAQVRANPTAGFSVVTYTGTGANATVGHGLGVAPSMIITKVRSTSGADWSVYHTSTGNTKSLFLNTTAIPSTSVNFWNNTSPTSSVFSVGISGGTNNSGNTMIAYCFAAVAGYSAFGSYTGNGAADGPFVYLGFRPRFIMTKRTDSTSVWGMWDSGRSTYNASTARLQAESSAAELNQAATTIDILSNGFKPRTADTDVNASGGTYIYMAFAEVPFKSALGR